MLGTNIWGWETTKHGLGRNYLVAKTTFQDGGGDSMVLYSLP
jgi:hypothetical protein